VEKLVSLFPLSVLCFCVGAHFHTHRGAGDADISDLPTSLFRAPFQTQTSITLLEPHLHWHCLHPQHSPLVPTVLRTAGGTPSHRASPEGWGCLRLLCPSPCTRVVGTALRRAWGRPRSSPQVRLAVTCGWMLISFASMIPQVVWFSRFCESQEQVRCKITT